MSVVFLLLRGVQKEERMAFRAEVVQLFPLVLQVGEDLDRLAGIVFGRFEVGNRPAVRLREKSGEGGVLGGLVAAELRDVQLRIFLVQRDRKSTRLNSSH